MIGGEKTFYLLKWKHSVMTRELKYLDKTGREPKRHDLVVLTKQRISHSKCCTHFCNFFFPWEFLKTVDAFDLSVGQELNSGVKVLLARSFQRSTEGCSHSLQYLSLRTVTLL